MKTYYFTVEGAGKFPLDMLRHAMCWAENTNDLITFSPTRRAVSLVSNHNPSNSLLRWKSFGWNIIESRNL